jgi:hypothetical protein
MAAKTSTVTVPAVTGGDANSALSKLSAAGLKGHLSQTRKSGTWYTVVSQTPGAGKKVTKGSTVDLGIRAQTSPASSAGTVSSSPSSTGTSSAGTVSSSPGPTAATPAATTTGGGTADAQQAAPGGLGGGGGGSGGGGSGGGGGDESTGGSASNTSASTTAPANATQQAADNDDQTDWDAFFSSGQGGYASTYAAQAVMPGSGQAGTSGTSGESS